MWQFVFGRLKEPSSWAGAAAVASQVVTAIQSKDPVAIVTVLLGIAAILKPEQGGSSGLK